MAVRKGCSFSDQAKGGGAVVITKHYSKLVLDRLRLGC